MDGKTWWLLLGPHVNFIVVVLVPERGKMPVSIKVSHP